MEQHEQSQQNSQSIPPTVKKSLWQRQKGPLIFFLLLIFFLPLFFIGFYRQSQKQIGDENNTAQNQQKTWKMELSYTPRNDSFVLDTITVLSEGFVPDNRSAKFSPYSVNVFDEKENILYTSPIEISQQILVDPLHSTSDYIPPKQPQVFHSIVYVPYFQQAVKITITHKDKTVLTVPVEAKTSFFPDSLQAFAQEQPPPAACGPMKVVFISDNYENLNDYHRDITGAIDVFKSVPPYKDVADSMFEYKTIDNKEPLGCKNGFVKCVSDRETVKTIHKIVEASPYRGASKIVILVNVAPTDSMGVASDIGGKIVVFPSFLQVGIANFKTVAVHEFLGHAVGIMWDRYVYKDPEYVTYYTEAMIKGTYPKSNCSNNKNEPFWVANGIAEGFPQCTTEKFFGPSKAACGNDGSRETVMSTTSCSEGKTTFDAVEAKWIEQKILPDYKACGGSGGSTSGPTPTPTKAPTPTPGSSGGVASPTPTSGGGGGSHLVCYPSGGIEKRYDSDTLIVENKIGRDVTIWIQQNYCDLGGRARRDGDPVCGTYLGRKTDIIKANEKKSYKMGTLLSCKNNSLNINTVNAADGGCYRNDNNQLWSGGQAFADKFVPKGSGACSAIPANGDDVVNRTVIPASLGTVDGGASSGSTGVTATATPKPKVTCQPDPACTAEQRSLQACQLICTQQ